MNFMQRRTYTTRVAQLPAMWCNDRVFVAFHGGRTLNFDCHYIGRGGRGLFVNSDGTSYPRTLTHLYSRTLATVTKADWNHQSFRPEAVFIVTGQSDFRSTKYGLSVIGS